MLRIALATLLTSMALTGAAFAQDDAIRGGNAGEFETRREGDDVAVVPTRRGPRFIAEAISFKAVDETHYAWMGSDDIFAEFTSPTASMLTRTVGNVDSGDTERFPRTQNCITPAIDPDRSKNGRWQCDPAGAEGPVRFSVTLLEDDEEIPIVTPPFVGGFCSPNGNFQNAGTDLRECTTTDWNDPVLEAELSFTTDEIIQRLNPSCTCFTQTLTSSNDDSTYQFTFRITMVDPGGGPELEQGQPGGGPVTPPVHNTGTLTAARNQHFEFDAGTVLANGGDFAFTESLDEFFLTPASGARIWLGGATARGYFACAAGAANHVTTAVQVPAIGSYACYITSDGRVGELRVDELRESGLGLPPRLTVTYTTWQSPP
jgi:hypothetical protein